MPEIRVTPQFIQLEDHISNYTSISGNRSTISVSNIGKIPCDISLQIKSETGHDQYFTLAENPDSHYQPENRLFSGLKTIPPNERALFDITPYLSANNIRENCQLEAIV